MKYELKQHFQIESARWLPFLPSEHPCSKMHGHSFKIVLRLIGDLDPKIGWMIDYNDIQKEMSPFLKMIDHQVLNQVPGLENPTSELLARWIFEKAKVALPSLVSVTIAETPATECTYPAPPY